MNYSIIKKYISQITKDMISSFGKQKGLALSNKEIDILYDVIHNNEYIDKILNNNEEYVFKKIEPYFSKENFKLLKNVFYTYKNKFI